MIDVKVKKQVNWNAVRITKTFPRFRFAATTVGKRWVPVADLPDAELAKHGFELASQGRTCANLDKEVQKLILLWLSKRKLDSWEQESLSDWLDRCPFQGHMAPIDIDIKGEMSIDQKKILAEKVSQACEKVGLGIPRWFLTGGNGIHGDHKIPSGLYSCFAVRAYGELVRKVASEAGIPTLNQHRSKADRPKVVIDDSIFDRDSTGRGSLWRLSGAIHNKTGRAKTPLFENQETKPADPEVIKKAFDLKEAEYPGEVERYENRYEYRQSRKQNKPISFEIGPEALNFTAKEIQRFLPPSGQRHTFRLALAGWLLKAGVNASSVIETLKTTEDTEDSRAAVKSTINRFENGQPVLGYQKLVSIVGKDDFLCLEKALDKDFAVRGGPIKNPLAELDPGERGFLRDAAEWAFSRGLDTRGRLLHRIQFCSLPSLEEHCGCSECGATQYTRKKVAGHPACPHCAWANMNANIQYIKDNWPNKFYALAVQLKDTKKETVQNIQKELSKRVKGYTLRYIVAPGWIGVCTKDPVAFSIAIAYLDYYQNKNPGVILNYLNRDHVHQEQAMMFALEELHPVLVAKATYFRRLILKGNVEEFVTDEWFNRTCSIRGSRKAQEEFPWPDNKSRRLIMVNKKRVKNGLPPLRPGDKAEDQKSKCCNASMIYGLFDKKAKKFHSIRTDRGFDFVEATVRHLNGSYGEFIDPKNRIYRKPKVKGKEELHIAFYPLVGKNRQLE